MATRAKKRPAQDPDTVVIRDAATLKALADPMRLQILMELGDEPKTVKEVATVLDTGPTRLYYHFKILEKAHLIRVAERRMVSGIEERRYQATAQSWTPAPDATASLVESGIVAALLGLVEAELDLALMAPSDTPIGEPGSPVPLLSLTRLALSDQDVAEVQRRIRSVVEEFVVLKKPPKGKRLYGAMITGYLAPSELDGRSGTKEAS